MNKKLTKLLTVFLLAGSVGMGAVGATGCHKHNYDEDHWVATADGSQHGHKAACHDAYKDVEDHVDADNNGKCDKCGEDMPGYTPPGATSTVSSVTVTAANGARTVYIGGDTVQLTAVVTGTNNPEQTVTWSSSDTSKATINEQGVVTGVAAANEVTFTATSTADPSKSNTIKLMVKEIPGVPANVADRAIVTAYSGPAAGPSSDAGDVTYKWDGADYEETTATTTVDDGILSFTSPEIRGRSPKDDNNKTLSQYTQSIKNGNFTIKVPTSGKLKFYFANGSGTAGKTKYKITGPGQSGNEVTVAKASSILNELEINVTEGTYTFAETGGGTIDMYLIELTLNNVQPAPIESISLVSAGTTEYLVTDKVDCTGVQLVAKDGNGVTHAVNLANCEFDTSTYNPFVSGEYTIGVTYKLSSNLTSEKKEFSISYTVKVYAVDSIELDFYGLSSSKQVTTQQVYLTGETYAKDSNISVMATCDLGGNKITKKLKNEWYSITESVDISTPGIKKITVEVDDAFTIANKFVNTSFDIVVAAKKNVENGVVKVTVGEHGEFGTLTQAVQYLKKCAYKDSDIKVIEIEEGTYVEKVWIDVPNVTLIGKGETADDTTITYSLVEGDADNLSGSLWALNCATVHVTGANFKAYNVAIRNDFDYIKNHNNYSGNQAAQGVALTLDADGAVLYNCHLYGNQDTLYMKSGRSYYKDTQIDGNIDFIFGGNTGIAFFENCKIVAINNTTADKGTNIGHVTAAQHVDGKKPNYGYIFYKCELTDDGHVADNAMSLGRPWGAKATVAYIECSFSAAYSTKESSRGRWESMSGATPANADFNEFGSTGDGAVSSAVAGGHILTSTQAANYNKTNIFGTSNGQVGYTTAWDCDTALDTLKIIAGLKSGELPQDTTVTINLKDDSLPNGNCVSTVNTKYSDYLTWAGTGSFELAKPQNGIKIGTDTVITIKVVGEVSVLAGYELPATDYKITYKDGKATIKFTAATGQYGTYIGGIVIDTSKTMPDTAD